MAGIGNYDHDLLRQDAPLDERIRALYRLKEETRSVAGHLPPPAHRRVAATDLLLRAVDTTSSVLLQHELIYNVGQFGCVEAVPTLKRIAADTAYDVVSRHEAIEAMGAIGDESALEFLTSLSGLGDPIAESALLASERVRGTLKNGRSWLRPPSNGAFASVDPTPDFAATSSDGTAAVSTPTTAELRDVLMNANGGVTLWDRYRAMFTLRNMGTPEAVQVLCEALRSDTSSCLFRHEVAFVLGQLESPASQGALAEAVRDESEHPMVRHEAAEAIGAIAHKATWPVLEEYSTHSEQIVRDSCIVALDMHRYWQQFKRSSDE